MEIMTHEIAKDGFMKILYVEDSQDVREIFSAKIEFFTGAEVVEAESVQNAKELLAKDNSIEVVITDYHMPDGNAGDIYSFIKEKNKNIPFVVFSSEELATNKSFESFFYDNPGNGQIQKPPTYNSLETTIQNAINNTKEGKKLENADKAVHMEQEFLPIVATMLIHFNSVPSDIFIKLSEQKFVKIINANDYYASDDIEKFLNKSIKFFYTNKNNYSSLLNFLFEGIFRMFPEQMSSATSPIIDLQEDLQKAIQTRLITLGVDQNVIEMTKVSIECAIKIIETQPDLKKIINKIRLGGNYTYDHSLIISYITGILANKMDWSSKDIKVKLSLASLIHDITLEDSDFAKLHDLEPEKISKDKDSKKYELYKNHIVKSAEFIKQMKGFPPDVDNIIIQSHELANGNGMPRGLGALSISSLSALFITSHLFVNELYIRDFKEGSSVEIIKLLELSSYKGNFKKPIDGLKLLFN